MIDLPTPPRQSERRAFQLAVGILVAAVAAAVWLSVGPAGWAAAAGLASFTMWMTIGYAVPRFVDRAYDGWNRMASLVARAGRLWVTAPLFAVVSLVGRAGSRLPVHGLGSRGAAWTPKPTAPPQSYSSQGTSGKGGDDHWLVQLARWAFRSGNEWSVLILPLLATLRLVHGRISSSLSAKNYTLY